jgi:hypothetical protein
LAAAENFPRDFFNRVFNSPCYETPKNAIKKSSKTTEGGKKKTEEKKPHIFCDEPRWIFEKIFLCF